MVDLDWFSPSFSVNWSNRELAEGLAGRAWQAQWPEKVAEESATGEDEAECWSD